MITSLFDLDRVVREATRRLAKARRALASRAEWDEPPPNPLAPFRAALGKDTFQELASVPDPLLAPALRAHVARLTLARVLWDDEVRVARAWSEPGVALDESVRLPALPKAFAAEGAGLVSPRALLAAVLADGEDARRARVAEAFARAARERLRDPTRFHAERRAAAAAQLGVALDDLDLPAPAAALHAAAGDLLIGTDAFAERFAPWDRGVARAMARDAPDGWPAHLHPRWVLSLFAGTDLGKPGVVDDVPLPAVLGGASFARALAAFGEAFGEAAAPSGAPFALARPPIDLRPLRIGALFGLLVGERVFARRALGLGQGTAREHARAFARAFAAHGRLFAAAVRTRPALFPPAAELDDRHCEETARAWGEPLPPALAGALPRIAEATPARFTAALLAALDRAHLVETHDEDWFRNPRATDALRAIAAEPSPPVTEDLLRKGAAELARLLAREAE